jgi:exodeoxyribonuclease VII small subunit
VTEASRAQIADDVNGLTFDEAFADLQRVVTVLEAGGLSLEATIAQYERAVALQRRCEQLLGAAELRVQQLLARPGGSLAAVDVRPEEATDDASGDASGDTGESG